MTGFRFPDDLAARPAIVPGRASPLRTELDALCEAAGVRMRVLAEVDDMAMVRLLARDTDALAVVPSVVVRDELRLGIVYELCAVPALSESFYATTARRRFEHPLLRSLLDRPETALLDDEGSAGQTSVPLP